MLRVVAVKPGDFMARKVTWLFMACWRGLPQIKAQDIGIRAKDIPASSEGADNINYKVWKACANEQLHKTGMLLMAGSGLRTGGGTSLALLCGAPVSAHVRTTTVTADRRSCPHRAGRAERSALLQLCNQHTGGTPRPWADGML